MRRLVSKPTQPMNFQKFFFAYLIGLGRYYYVTKGAELQKWKKQNVQGKKRENWKTTRA